MVMVVLEGEISVVSVEILQKKHTHSNTATYDYIYEPCFHYLGIIFEIEIGAYNYIPSCLGEVLGIVVNT